jgi:hypothetical protein
MLPLHQGVFPAEGIVEQELLHDAAGAHVVINLGMQPNAANSRLGAILVMHTVRLCDVIRRGAFKDLASCLFACTRYVCTFACACALPRWPGCALST